MPIRVGLGEVLLLLVVAAGILFAVRFAFRTLRRLGGGHRERELERARRDLERVIARERRREELPRE